MYTIPPDLLKKKHYTQNFLHTKHKTQKTKNPQINRYTKRSSKKSLQILLTFNTTFDIMLSMNRKKQKQRQAFLKSLLHSLPLYPLPTHYMYYTESPIQWEHLYTIIESPNQYRIEHEDGTNLCQFWILQDKNIVFSFHTINDIYKKYIIEYATKIANNKILFS